MQRKMPHNNLFSGGVARGIMNRTMRELGPLNPAVPPFPRGGSALVPLRAAAEARGSVSGSRAAFLPTSSAGGDRIEADWPRSVASTALG